MWLELPLLIILAQSGHTGGMLAQQAHEAFEAGRFSEACDELKQALNSDPGNAALWSDLGVTYAKLNQTELAIAAFRKARSLSPKNSQIFFTLGILYTQKGEVDQALSSYKEGMALEPANEPANQNYALLLLRTGRYKAAIEPLEKLKSTGNSGLPVRVALVEAYLKSGLKGEGEEQLNDLLAAPAISDSDKLRIADLLIEDSEADAAQTALDRLRTDQPGSAAILAKLGALYSKQGRYKEAAQALRGAIRADPSSSEYMRTYTELLLKAKLPWAAVEFLQSVKDRFGTVPDFQYKLGLAYYEAGLFTDAIAEFGELARDYPQRPEPQFYLGNCYKALKQFDKAEGSYRRAIELKPDEAQYYTFLADTLREQKSDNTKEVIALLGKALALDASDTNAQLGLALCYESEGNLKKAESLLEEAVSREPALRRAHVLLAKVYGREGKTQLAAQEGAVIGRLDTAEQERRSKAMGTSANQSR